ncbi:sensor histidine kinase [Cupriavidus sp. 30B13]|uniref:sensor histidine kinase n=1 Tax=Cupriavidus sp. 30B13 TaxID=3384241 RepID=UPI003B8EB222
MSQQHSPSGDGCEDEAPAAGGVSNSAEVASLIGQVAHDLRSALNGVQSWAYVLDHTLDTPPAGAQRALAGIRTGMQQQVALIEHMEEAVALLADESAPQWQRTDLEAALLAAIEAVRPFAEGRGVTLPGMPSAEAAPPAGTPMTIDADPRRLPPLLRHLLIHCIRHARGGDAVEARLHPGGDHITLRITESRVPSEARRHERVAVLSDFFLRRPPPEGAAAPRQGTALMLTRRLAETHGARIEAEGQGCAADGDSVCIAVRFPLHVPRA